MAGESLLCNELWLMVMTPAAGQHGGDHQEVSRANEEEEAVLHENHPEPNCDSHSTTVFSHSDVDEEDFEEAVRGFLRKEIDYVPESGYMKHVRENCRIDKARVAAILWFVKSQRRLNLSLETLFNAANYFDRFCSLKKCQVFNDWMFELLCVACLSTASKFIETSPPSLHQIQMEDQENSFDSSLIQRMELNLLRSLEWRLRPATSYSYVERLTGSSSFDLFGFNNKRHLVMQEFNERVTDLLVNALLDSKFLEFLPSVIAMSALQHIYKEFEGSDSVCMARFAALISPDQQENLIKCYEMMMEEKCFLDQNCNSNDIPSSPVTVLANTTLQCCFDFRHFCQAAARHHHSNLLNRKNNAFMGTPKKRKRALTYN